MFKKIMVAWSFENTFRNNIHVDFKTVILLNKIKMKQKRRVDSHYVDRSKLRGAVSYIIVRNLRIYMLREKLIFAVGAYTYIMHVYINYNILYSPNSNH